MSTLRHMFGAMRTPYRERPAVICLGGWSGRTEAAVVVVDETAKRYRIKAIDRTKLAGRDRWIEAGQTALVPKRAVRFTDQL